ncbi:unnamed protein product [Linum tenue]|jgi:hypothetical protein
MMVDY